MDRHRLIFILLMAAILAGILQGLPEAVESTLIFVGLK